MTDEKLQDELRSLPRQRASEGFTRGVLEALDESARRPAWAPMALAGAAVGLAGLLLVVALGLPVRSTEVPDMVPGPLVRLSPPPVEVAGDGTAATPSRWAPPAGDAALSEVQRVLAELKAEHAGVENDWRTLRRLAREAEPVLYMAGTDSADMVLDLRRLEETRTRLRVTPAAVRRASEMTY